MTKGQNLCDYRDRVSAIQELTFERNFQAIRHKICKDFKASRPRKDDKTLRICSRGVIRDTPIRIIGMALRYTARVRYVIQTLALEGHVKHDCAVTMWMGDRQGQTPNTGLRHPSFKGEGAGKRCRECGNPGHLDFNTAPQLCCLSLFLVCLPPFMGVAHPFLRATT